jgi:hypothetical protein
LDFRRKILQSLPRQAKTNVGIRFRSLPLLYFVLQKQDIMPTLLGLCGLTVPPTVRAQQEKPSFRHVSVEQYRVYLDRLRIDTTRSRILNVQQVQGRDLSAQITGEQPVDPNMSTLLKVPVPYHLLRTQGITEFRGAYRKNLSCPHSFV